MTSKLRTVVHLVALLIPFLAEATSKSIILAILIAVTITYILSEELRLRGKQLPLITKFTLRMSRENETPRLVTAPIYLAVGVIMSLLLFPKNIAYASITIVAVGDPMAAYVRQKVWSNTCEEEDTGGFCGRSDCFVCGCATVGSSLSCVSRLGCWNVARAS